MESLEKIVLSEEERERIVALFITHGTAGDRDITNLDWLRLFTMTVSSDPALSLGFFLLGSAFNKSVKSRTSETFSPIVCIYDE